jgi:hypothetical protein
MKKDIVVMIEEGIRPDRDKKLPFGNSGSVK